MERSVDSLLQCSQTLEVDSEKHAVRLHLDKLVAKSMRDARASPHVVPLVKRLRQEARQIEEQIQALVSHNAALEAQIGLWVTP